MELQDFRIEHETLIPSRINIDKIPVNQSFAKVKWRKLYIQVPASEVLCSCFTSF